MPGKRERQSAICTFTSTESFRWVETSQLRLSPFIHLSEAPINTTVFAGRFVEVGPPGFDRMGAEAFPGAGGLEGFYSATISGNFPLFAGDGTGVYRRAHPLVLFRIVRRVSVLR